MYTQIFFVTSVSTRHLLATADLGKRVAQGLRGEDSDALLLHGSRHLLAVRLQRGLARGLLRRLDRRLRRLRNRRLRRRGRDRRLRGLRHCD